MTDSSMIARVIARVWTTTRRGSDRQVGVPLWFVLLCGLALLMSGLFGMAVTYLVY